MPISANCPRPEMTPHTATSAAGFPVYDAIPHSEALKPLLMTVVVPAHSCADPQAPQHCDTADTPHNPDVQPIRPPDTTSARRFSPWGSSEALYPPDLDATHIWRDDVAHAVAWRTIWRRARVLRPVALLNEISARKRPPIVSCYRVGDCARDTCVFTPPQRPLVGTFVMRDSIQPYSSFYDITCGRNSRAFSTGNAQATYFSYISIIEGICRPAMNRMFGARDGAK
ncbi:hypothetical protein C8J57DRAFT_1633295 [Mycena rebaudengoi]|nr:hypothetical protein C8J57DRAFT_1633295 [Mycena rebaudengoi]